MFRSIKLGTVFGIKIRMHGLFVPAIVILMALSNMPPAEFLGGVFVLVGVVFLHELGHSFMARRFGIRVIDITFWPLGGMARMTEIPEDSKVEGLIALAGPAVNFALAFLTVPVLILSGALDGSRASSLLAQGTMYFFWVNLAIGGFNLLPAFPMDGGRVLRAFLGRKGNWLAATERAVQVGKLFAILMFLAALLDGGWVLGMIGVFVWVAGSRELLGVRMRHAPRGSGMAGLGGLRDLFEAARQAQAQATDPRAAAYDSARAAERDESFDAPPADAHQPLIEPSSGAGRHGRVTDEEIERLESFRGRMRNYDRDV